jgi:hypothetical protein
VNRCCHPLTGAIVESTILERTDPMPEAEDIHAEFSLSTTERRGRGPRGVCIRRHPDPGTRAVGQLRMTDVRCPVAGWEAMIDPGGSYDQVWI